MLGNLSFLDSRKSIRPGIPGSIAQSVMSLIADQGVVSFIPAQTHTFVDIDCEIFFTFSLLLRIQEGLVSVTIESKCTKYWLTA